MYWADEMVPKRENGQAANRRLTRYIKFIISLRNAHSACPCRTGPRSTVVHVSGYNCESDCRSRDREFDPGLVPYFRGD